MRERVNECESALERVEPLAHALQDQSFFYPNRFLTQLSPLHNPEQVSRSR